MVQKGNFEPFNEHELIALNIGIWELNYVTKIEFDETVQIV